MCDDLSTYARRGAPAARTRSTQNNYYTTSMDGIESLFAFTPWLSDPGISFSAFLERRAPPWRERSGADADLRGLSLITAGQAPVRASVASTADELAAAALLVESRYAWRGYAVTPYAGAAGATLVATQGATAVGTLTLRTDGPAGLAADEGYRQAVDAVRRAGRRVCELTRLAIEADAAWRPTLGALIGLAYLVGRAVHDVTDVFVEVNPRHERFYERMFGFVAAAGRRVCPRVDAPAVLLRLEVERLDLRLRNLGLFAPVGGASVALAA